VKLRTAVSAKRMMPMEGFEDFIFGNGAVKEGWVRRGRWKRPRRAGRQRAPGGAHRDGSGAGFIGGARSVVPDLPRDGVPQEMAVEMEFRDPTWVQTVSSRIPLWNAGYLVGIRPDGWAISKDALTFQPPSWTSRAGRSPERR